MYQFYQAPAKARVYAKIRARGKVKTHAEIAAATQLYTNSYLVQWLLQNSLGRSYQELFPTSKLPRRLEILPAQVGGRRACCSIRRGKRGRPDYKTFYSDADGAVLRLRSLLREAFDMLAEMYLEQVPSWNATKIADHVLEHHLYGINIDPRAIQLTSLTLYLRAWEFVRDAHSSTCGTAS